MDAIHLFMYRAIGCHTLHSYVLQCWALASLAYNLFNRNLVSAPFHLITPFLLLHHKI